MEIQWISNTSKGVVTFYETNITLNTIASSYFIGCHGVLIGFDSKNQNIIIKSLSKEEIDSGVYLSVNIHQIAVKASYGRISGKNIVSNIMNYYRFDFSAKNMYKFGAQWDAAQKALIINMKEELK